jgi:hypothetical protein
MPPERYRSSSVAAKAAPMLVDARAMVASVQNCSPHGKRPQPDMCANWPRKAPGLRLATAACKSGVGDGHGRPSAPLKTSTRAPSCWANALMMLVPRPAFAWAKTPTGAPIPLPEHIRARECCNVEPSQSETGKRTPHDPFHSSCCHVCHRCRLACDTTSERPIARSRFARAGAVGTDVGAATIYRVATELRVGGASRRVSVSTWSAPIASVHAHSLIFAAQA